MVVLQQSKWEHSSHIVYEFLETEFWSVFDFNYGFAIPMWDLPLCCIKCSMLPYNVMLWLPVVY